MIVRKQGSGTREVLERILKENNLIIQDFQYLTEIGNLNTIKSMICNGMDISFFIIQW